MKTVRPDVLKNERRGKKSVRNVKKRDRNAEKKENKKIKSVLREGGIVAEVAQNPDRGVDRDHAAQAVATREAEVETGAVDHSFTCEGRTMKDVEKG